MSNVEHFTSMSLVRQFCDRHPQWFGHVTMRRSGRVTMTPEATRAYVAYLDTVAKVADAVHTFAGGPAVPVPDEHDDLPRPGPMWNPADGNDTTIYQLREDLAPLNCPPAWEVFNALLLRDTDAQLASIASPLLELARAWAARDGNRPTPGRKGTVDASERAEGVQGHPDALNAPNRTVETSK
jgi:hypothetical protein